MKRRIKQALPVILVFVGLALTSSFCKAQGVLLRYNLKVGETISINTTINQNTSIMGQDMTTTMTMKMYMTATEKTDSIVTTQAQLKAMTYNANILGNTVAFDSDHMEDADPSVAASFKELLDKTFDVVYDIYGNIISAPEDYPQEQGATAVFPKEMVYEGSQWTRDTKSEINGEMAHSVGTYTVKKITEKDTELEFTGYINSDSGSIKSDLSGTMLIENETGLPITATMKIPMTMTVEGTPVSMMQTISITSEKVH